MITEKDVKHIAKLSKLEFSEKEIEELVLDMSQIVSYVDTLEKVDTSNVKENLNLLNLEDLREDEIENSLSQQDAIKNAPHKKNGGFSVPQVVE